MASWPATLPQKQFVGTRVKDDDAVLRTPMDAGPPTTRNRFTAVSRSVSCPIVLTGAQKATFDAFYRTTLANGSSSFTWEDPSDDSTVSFKFKGYPELTLFRGGAAAKRLWSGTLELEQLP